MNYRVILVAPSSYLTPADQKLIDNGHKPTFLEQLKDREAYKMIVNGSVARDDQGNTGKEILLVPSIIHPQEATIYSDALSTMARRCNKKYGYNSRLTQLDSASLPNMLEGDLSITSLYQIINEMAIKFPNGSITLEVIVSDENKEKLKLNKLLVPFGITLNLRAPNKEPHVIVGEGYIDPNYRVQETLDLVEAKGAGIQTEEVHTQRELANQEYYRFNKQLLGDKELPQHINGIANKEFREKIKELSQRLYALATQWNNEHSQTEFLQNSLKLLQKMALQPELAEATKLDQTLAAAFTFYSKLDKLELRNKLPQITAVLKNFDTLLTYDGNTPEQRKKTEESVKAFDKFEKAQHFKAAALITAGTFNTLAAIGIMFLLLMPVNPLLVIIATSVATPILFTSGIALLVAGGVKSNEAKSQEQAKGRFFAPAKTSVDEFAIERNAAPENQSVVVSNS